MFIRSNFSPFSGPPHFFSWRAQKHIFSLSAGWFIEYLCENIKWNLCLAEWQGLIFANVLYFPQGIVYFLAKKEKKKKEIGMKMPFTYISNYFLFGGIEVFHQDYLCKDRYERSDPILGHIVCLFKCLKELGTVYGQWDYMMLQYL